MDHKEPEFKGFKQLVADLNLRPDEKVGVTVSGGKDSAWMWMKMVDILGPDKVVAFNHRKDGLVHPIADANVKKAQEILKTELIVVNDTDMLPRFRRNLPVLLSNPDPAMVRVATCVGCRHGITGAMYKEGERVGVTKFMSGASYLELAPYKAELMKRKGNGDEHKGLEVGLKENPGYGWSQENLALIDRDDKHCYKADISGKKSMAMYPNVQFFDLDTYVPNLPERNENEVKERLGWERPARSWHFDCQVETFKDVLYYGKLGYTETDYNLSAMVRYGLIDRHEAVRRLSNAREEIVNSERAVLNLMDQLGVGDSKEQMREFYRSSPFLSELHR